MQKRKMNLIFECMSMNDKPKVGTMGLVAVADYLPNCEIEDSVMKRPYNDKKHFTEEMCLNAAMFLSCRYTEYGWIVIDSDCMLSDALAIFLNRLNNLIPLFWIQMPDTDELNKVLDFFEE